MSYNENDRPAPSQNGQQAERQERQSMLNPVKPTKEAVMVVIPMYGKTKCIEVDYNEIRAKEPVKIGNIYPDLYTQVISEAENIEEAKNEIAGGISAMFSKMGIDGALLFLEAVWSEVYRTVGEMGEGDSIGMKEFTGIADDVYTASEMVKLLLQCYESSRRLGTAAKALEYATQGILL